MNNIAFVILSCDKFKITWKPCVDHIFNAWPNCPYPIYLLNNFHSSTDGRVIDLMVGKDLNWSDTLIKGLIKIKEDRVFFIYDDSFITKFNKEEIEQVFKIAIDKDLDSVALRKRKFDSGKRFNNALYKIKSTAKYRNSLFLNLIKKNLLLVLLKSGENAWQFEKDGNVRNRSYDFYSVYNSQLVNYKHGIVKGKWLPKSYTYLKEKGYLLEGNSFDIHSKLKMFSMNIYTLLFYFVHRITHLLK